MKAFQQDGKTPNRLYYSKSCIVTANFVTINKQKGNIILRFEILSRNVGKNRDIKYSKDHEIEIYKNPIYIKKKYKDKLNINLCEDDSNIDEVNIFREFLKESDEILRLKGFIDDDETKGFLCRAFIELMEEDRLNLSDLYGYTYLMLLELNLELAENNKEFGNELYDALRKWLSVCQNSQYTSFKSEKLNREDKIDKALFKDGKPKVGLKEYIKEYIKKDPRFRDLIRNTAVNWYLKARYNIWTAKRLLCAVNSKSQLFNCFLPRMFSAIIVGYLPLVMQGDAWKLAYRMYTYHPLLLLFVVMPLIFIASFAYLYIEIAKISANWKVRLKRTSLVWVIGLLESFVVGLTMCIFISEHFSSIILGLEDVFIEPVHCLGYPQAFFLFFPLAMFIGLFVQILWEDKPITHPL